MSNFLYAFSKVINGVPTSILFTVVSLFIALIIAILLTAANLLCGKVTRNSIKLYTIIITGTPLLIQIFLVYYGPSQFDFVKSSIFWDLLSNTYFCGFLALILNSTAYTTIIFTGAFKSIDIKQWEVSRSMGLTNFQIFRLLLPYAIRRVLPVYNNEVIALFKSTSLISVITISDIMGEARQYNSENYDALSAFVSAGIIYLLISSFFTLSIRFVESKWLKHSVN